MSYHAGGEQAVTSRTAATMAVLLVAGQLLLPHDARPAPPCKPDLSSLVAPQPSPAVSLNDVYRHLAERREQQIERLRCYASRGRFPRNTDFPDRARPYFVDSAGTHCAVAHLMREDGHNDAVLAIAAADNHVLVDEVCGGPLRRWILTSGLTQAECARIQPTYGYGSVMGTNEPSTEALERDRLRIHFTKVEAELVRNSDASLETALREWIDDEMAREEPRSRKQRQARRQREPVKQRSKALDVEQLLAALGSDEAGVRLGAIHALRRSRLTTARRVEITPHLDRALRDPDPRVRFWAAIALHEGAPRGVTSYPHRLTRTAGALLAGLDSPDATLRRIAVIQLGLVAPECLADPRFPRAAGEKIVAAIERAIEDTDPVVAEEARQITATERWQSWAELAMRGPKVERRTPAPPPPSLPWPDASDPTVSTPAGSP